MYKKRINIKQKFVNFLTIKGKKATNEKNFKKSIKTIQKLHKKTTKDILKCAVIKATIPFKILVFKQKKRKQKKVKEIPFFLKNYKDQVNFAIKNIIKAIKNHKNQACFLKLQKEIIVTTQLKNESTKIKENIQKFITTKRHLLVNFKW